MGELIEGVTTVWELVERRAALTPDAPILIETSGATTTCRELRDRAEATAAGLHALGVGPGTVVTWQLPTRVETIVVAMALARLGAVQNPIIHLYREREVGAVLRASKPSFFLVPEVWKDEDRPAMARALAAALTPSPTVLAIDAGALSGDPAALPPPPTDGHAVRWVYYTSGTTSDPKGVQHTDSTLMAGGRGLATALDMQPDDVGSIAFPFAHIAGPDYFFMMLLAGFPAILLESFVPADAVESFAKLGATMAGGSTAHYSMFLAEQRRAPGPPVVPSLRKLAGGGAPKPPEIYHQVLAEMGIPVLHGYGMTECPMIAQGGPHDSPDQLAHTEGKPVVGIEVRTVSADGTVCAQGVEGEVRVRGSIVCKGYTDPELTAAAFDDDGWFKTGDLGVIRPDGHIALTGRLKDVIIRKGENISAKELEDLLFAHASVKDVAVIGVPDAERGEMVVAVVETADGAEPLTFEEMVAYLDGHGLMRQKIPERLEVVAALPRNETLNKVLKYKLREQLS